MNFKAILFGMVLSIFSLVTIAGTGHDHSSPNPVSQSQAEAIALDSVSKLAEKGKIDGSWKSIKVSKSEKKEFGGHMEWMIIFVDKKIADPAQQTLYVFLSLGGEYLAANYTGE